MVIHTVLNLAEVAEGSQRLAAMPPTRGHLYLVLEAEVEAGR